MEQLFGFHLILVMTEKRIQKVHCKLYKMYAYINTYLRVFINSKDYICLYLKDSESHTVDIMAFSLQFSHF
jgi:intein-encoded DNA endonuclease-like protein